jgi:hypothetical protein
MSFASVLPESGPGGNGVRESAAEQAAKRDDLLMRVFKTELREALADPRRLPGDELFNAVDYGDGSDE